MKRLIALLVLAAVALAPSAALAKPRAKVYRGTFQFVGADSDYVTGRFGHAQLVDGRRNDKLSVHVRRLAPRTLYVFRLQQARKACAADAPAATDVDGWRYRHRGVLKTNRRGVANGFARSRTFTARRGVEYLVGVYTLRPDRTPGELVLCAELKRRGHGKSHAKAEDKARGKSKDKGRGQAEDKARGKAEDKSRGQAEDKPSGKPDDKPRNKSTDTPRGRSDDEPGRDDESRGQARGRDEDKPHGRKRGG